jgi:hypothetical protein
MLTGLRQRPTRSQVAFAAVVVLWAIGAAIVLVGTLLDVRGRASSPEAPLRTYLAAVTDEDLQAALLEIAPSARAGAAPFVAEQLGNAYHIRGIGVRQPSLLDRLLGRAGSSDHVLITVQLDITLLSGERWRATTHVPVVREPDGWYLARAPLQPEPTSDP